ncbi:MAG: ABC transporter permease [Polyangiaceae bacterium]
MRASDRILAVRRALTSGSRTFLTMLGLVIGAGSIVLLASLLTGGQDALARASQDVTDADLVEVYRRDPPSSEAERTQRPLSRRDVVALRDSQVLGAASVSSQSHYQGHATEGGHTKRVRVVAGDPSTLATYRLTVERGRFLTEEDGTHGRRVAVVGREVWSELFGDAADFRTTSLHVDDEVWTIVGILSKKPYMGATDSTYVWDRKVIVPARVYDAMYAPSHEVNELQIERGRADVATTRRLVDGALARLHLNVRNFKVADGKDGDIDGLVQGTLLALLVTTGFLALFASGINVMNVMLVAVTERTREIGIRRALGATARDVGVQFVLEAAAISFAGGALGVLFGGVLAWGASFGLGALFGHWPFHVPVWSIALGLGASTTVGVVFGWLPAVRAAKVLPIVALRSE